MNWCLSKRSLSSVDDSTPVFSLDNYNGYAKITSVYDGDTFNAVIMKHGRVLKFRFRTLGYDSAEMKPSLAMEDRNEHIYLAKLARDMFKQECGFDDRMVPQLWNPFMCRNKVNGWVWIQCYKNDKYGRPLVTVYRHKGDKISVNQKMIASGIVNVYNGKTKAVFR
jgi:endonuclease YncB( thermonuclease family)|tara:strand:- start:1731 stop:2228 length:498 start_codon:yes stop_codon:yes gene_type:complete